MINNDLKNFVKNNIIPKYINFDKAHNLEHVQTVIDESLRLAKTLDVDFNMVYTIAAYHDLGLIKGRETHHIVSGKILENDDRLNKWFDTKQITIMKEAVEDHRASSKTPPRSIYGKIVAEADRDIIPLKIIRRTIQYSIAHNPDADKELHQEHLIEHMEEKYSERGYLKLWLPNSKNAPKLEELRQIINNKIQLDKVFEMIYQEEISEHKL